MLNTQYFIFVEEEYGQKLLPAYIIIITRICQTFVGLRYLECVAVRRPCVSKCAGTGLSTKIHFFKPLIHLYLCSSLSLDTYWLDIHLCHQVKTDGTRPCFRLIHNNKIEFFSKVFLSEPIKHWISFFRTRIFIEKKSYYFDF